jgi:hypothetical protein
VTQEDNVIELSHVLNNSKILFFAGSGVSWDYPACLPTASQVLEMTAHFTLPPAEIARREVGVDLKEGILKLIQPEVFYEQLWRLIGPKAAAPWRVLESYKTDHELQHIREQLGPTMTHYIIVLLAWKHKVPVITTNFDTFFEDAAANLQIRPGVNVKPILYIPHYTSDGVLDYVPKENEVLIWKVHGDIGTKGRDAYSSLMTTMVRITQLNMSLLKRVEEFMNQIPFCFVGYSARDLDLFRPLVMRRQQLMNPQPIFWIDPPVFKKPEEKLNEWEKGLLERARLVDAKPVAQCLDDVVRRNCPKLAEQLASCCPDMETNQAMDLSTTRAPQTRESLIEHEKDRLAKEKILEMNPSLKQYFFALVLKETGLFCEAFAYLQNHIEDFKKQFESRYAAYALLTLASLCHENSKYIQVENYAQQAYELARHERLQGYPLVESICLQCEAKRMQLNGRIGFNDLLDWKGTIKVWWHFRKNLIRLRGLVHPYGRKFALVRAVLWPIHLFWDPPKPHKVQDFDLIYVWGSFLEHKIRLNALLQGASEIAAIVVFGQLPFIGRFIPKRYRAVQPGQLFLVEKFLICPMKSWLRWRWRIIHSDSERIGYAGGIANTDKYAARPDRDQEVQESARQIYELLTSPTGRAILARDRGQQLLKTGNKEEALKEYQLCWKEAKAVCNHSLALKGLIGIYLCTGDTDRVELMRLSDAIEGEGYRDYFKRLFQKLNE